MKVTNYKDADMVFYGTLPAGRKTFFPTSTLSKDAHGKFSGEFVELTEIYSRNPEALKLEAGRESRRTTNQKLLSLYESLGISPELEEKSEVTKPQVLTLKSEPSTANRLISSTSCKPFTILAGGTGTGKTRSAILAATSIAGKENLEVVSVGADWTDNRALLGFRNLLAEGGKTYVAPSALRIILKALETPIKPFFLILDEMNLSHVERYFADFLSSMESKEPLKLHDSSEPLNTEDGISVPGKITYPHNLFVIGTVNIDETTYMFSPKVLDRAHVIEFKVTWDEIADGLEGAVPSELPPLSLEQVDAFMRISQLKDKTLSDEDHALLTKVLEDLHAALEGTRFVFAHRTARECLNFVASAQALAKVDITSPQDTKCLIDLAILQKALPKLNGASGTLSKVLEDIIKVADKHDLDLCKEKLEAMSRQLKADQFVSFIQ
jgi:5-methylcytosine-specific restriction protein B